MLIPRWIVPPRPLARTRRAAQRVLRGAGGWWDRFAEWFNGLGLSENAILLAFAVAIGAAGALGVVLFYSLIDLAFSVFFRWPSEYLPRIGQVAYRPFITACGFAAAWWLYRRFGQGHEGLHVPDVQLAVARRGGEIPTRPALAKTAAAAVTLGSGGSAGSEGPVAVLGATIGSFLGRAFRFDPSRIKVLVGAGAAAGISASFNAPLAGAFFALEEILGSFAVTAFPPVVVASVIAAVVSHAFLGNNPAFPIPVDYGYALSQELLVFYPFLGVVAGLMSVFFVRTYFKMESIGTRLRIRPALLPWIGGLVVGSLVLASDGQLVGHGHFAFRLDVFGRMPWTTLALLAIGSVIATSITLNTGGSGGLFTPSLFVGAATGGAFGVALTELFPALGLRPEAYALVGMGATVAAATGAPITGILLVFEMTNDYNIVLPLMLATVIAFLVARRFERDTLYSGWLRRRGEHLEHGTDRDVLAGLLVADAYDRAVPVAHEGVPVAELLDHLGRGDYIDFPVVDDERRFIGMITVADLGRIAKQQADEVPFLVAADVAQPTEAVTPEDSLLVAIRRLGARGSPSIPVVNAGGHLLGLVGRTHILSLYERAVAGTAPPGSPPSPSGPRVVP